ncbi:P1 family peptidase, partial [Oceanithermus sp.]
KREARMLAEAGQAALGRVIRPSHTPWDGDAVFLLSTGRGAAAPLAALADLVEEAVCAAVTAAAG